MFNGDVGAQHGRDKDGPSVGQKSKGDGAVREREVTWNLIDKEQEEALKGQVRRRASQHGKGTGSSGELKPRLSGALLFP